MTTDRFKRIIMENVFKVTSPTYSIPTTYYIGISTSNTTSGEPASSTGYTRKSLTGLLAYNTSTYMISNTAGTDSGEIVFDNSQGSSDWFSANSPAAYYIITDSSTVRSGNLVAYGSLQTPKPILAGDTAKINSGDLKRSISDLS